MKNSKKIVSVLLTGTLAFSSIGVAPMMAFADELSTEETVYTVTNGYVEDGALEAQGIIGVGGNRLGRMSLFYPDTADYNRMALDAINNYYDMVRYPKYSRNFVPYTGTITGSWYRQYAVSIANDILPNIKPDKDKDNIRKQIEDLIKKINENPNAPQTQIDAWLDEIYTLAKRYDSKYDWNQYYNRYLPYEWNYRWDWRNYDYDWYWGYRPSDKKSSSSSSSSSTKQTVTVYRLLNPANGDHVYNSSSAVREKLIADGWKSEGNAWKALEDSSKPVYQLRNTVTGRYHYTTNSTERDNLVANKWENDGVAFYASDSSGTKVYRVLNPVNGSHFFTKSTTERNDLVKAGWADEGVAFYVSK